MSQNDNTLITNLIKTIDRLRAELAESERQWLELRDEQSKCRCRGFISAAIDKAEP
jgi:hypothetical protein